MTTIDELPKAYCGRRYYPPGSALPEGAHGWTCIIPDSCGSSTWLEPQYAEQCGADIVSIQKEADAIRTHAEMDEKMAALGGFSRSREPLSVRRTTYQIARHRQLWPYLLTPEGPSDAWKAWKR